MAQNAASGIAYYLLIHQSRKDDLAAIRRWRNLKVAFEEEHVWVKDLDQEQAHSVEVKSLPYKTIYACRNGKLHAGDSLLPERHVPALLWTAIDRALPVKLPAFNHNYFGMNVQLGMRLVPSETERPAVAMLATLRDLGDCLETLAAVRLASLQWALLNTDTAFIIGQPLLPVKGQAYWQQGRSLFPAGLELELPVLANTLDHMLDPGNRHWIVWAADASYALVDRGDTGELSLSAFRKTMLHHSIQNR